MRWTLDGNVMDFGDRRPQFGERCYLAPGGHVIGDVVCGDDVSIWFNTIIRGDVHHIRIGNRTNIQDNSVVHVTSGLAPTIIGDDVTIGHGAIIHACTIGNRVLIGMGAIILDQAVIPDECLVAAGALVSPGKTFPPGTLLRGSPAKVVRDLTDEERSQLLDSAKHYVNLTLNYLRRN